LFLLSVAEEFGEAKKKMLNSLFKRHFREFILSFCLDAKRNKKIKDKQMALPVCPANPQESVRILQWLVSNSFLICKVFVETAGSLFIVYLFTYPANEHQVSTMKGTVFL